MNRKSNDTVFIIAALLAVLAVRILDVVLHTEPQSGYIEGGTLLLRIAALALIALVHFATLRFNRRRYKELYPAPAVTEGKAAAAPSAEPAPAATIQTNLPLTALFFAGGIAAVVYSVGLYFEVGVPSAFSLLFKGKAALLAAGQINGLFKFDLVVCLFGIAAALWFIMSAFWYAKGHGRFIGGRFYSVVLVLWLYLRVIREFFNRSINPSNSLAVVATFSIVFLAVFYTKYAKFISLDFNAQDVPSMVAWGFTSFLVVCGLQLPSLYSYILQQNRFMIIETACNIALAVLALVVALRYRFPRAAAEPVEEKEQ